MIAVFTNPNNNSFINWVKEAARLANLSHEQIEVIPLTFQGLEARHYVDVIKKTNVCIVDIDELDILNCAIELGSLGHGVAYIAGERDNNHSPSMLDSRLMLVTHKSLLDNRIIQLYGDYYSCVSLEHGENMINIKGLSDWIVDTVNSNASRIFISYRSIQKTFARKIAQALLNKGASIWFDEINILPGDSITTEINRGLGWCSHLVLIIDETYFQSKWTQVEVDSILYSHLSGDYKLRVKDTPRFIIPIYLIDPKSPVVPIIIRNIRGIDCRNTKMDIVIDQIWNSITSLPPQ